MSSLREVRAQRGADLSAPTTASYQNTENQSAISQLSRATLSDPRRLPDDPRPD